MIPKVIPSKHHGNSIPHIPQGAGGDEARLCAHQCPLSSLFTPFELGNPERGEMAKLRCGKAKWLVQDHSWEAESQAWNPPAPVLQRRKEKPKGECPCFADEEVETEEVGSSPSHSVNTDQVFFQLSWVFIHLSTGLDLPTLPSPRDYKILLLATVSCIQGHVTATRCN